MFVMPRRSWLLAAVLGLLMAAPGALLFAQTAAIEPTPQIYTCIDAKGRKLTSDRPIVACSDREQIILNPSGTVKARIGPVLTPYEQSQSEARLRAEQKERVRKEEERSLSRALLARYPNQAAHQKDRAEALAQVALVKQIATTRVSELLAERANLSDEMAFYVKNPGKAPIKLQRQIRELSQTLAAQERFVVEQDNEVKRVNAHFDEELKRLESLWRAELADEPVGASR